MFPQESAGHISTPRNCLYRSIQVLRKDAQIINKTQDSLQFRIEYGTQNTGLLLSSVSKTHSIGATISNNNHNAQSHGLGPRTKASSCARRFDIRDSSQSESPVTQFYRLSWRGSIIGIRLPVSQHGQVHQVEGVGPMGCHPSIFMQMKHSVLTRKTEEKMNLLSNAIFFLFRSSCVASATGMKHVYTQRRGELPSQETL